MHCVTPGKPAFMTKKKQTTPPSHPGARFCRSLSHKILDKSDMVNNPPHYVGNIECIEAIEESLTADQYIGYLKGQVFKYLWRENRKKDRIQDLQKANWYLNRLINFLKDNV